LADATVAVAATLWWQNSGGPDAMENVIPFPPDAVGDNAGPYDTPVPIPPNVPQICRLIKETPGNDALNGICLYQCPDGTRIFLEKNKDCGETCPSRATK
jgi:hypothetical protein